MGYMQKKKGMYGIKNAFQPKITKQKAPRYKTNTIN